MTERLTGVVTPLLTPYENNYSIAESLYLEHAAYCLDGGAPGISVFPASETLLSRAMALGAGSCISASCNSNIMAVRRLYEALRVGDWDEAKKLQPRLETHRVSAQNAGLISGLKSLKADQSGDRRWLNLRPPYQTADPALGSLLAKTISQ